MKSITRADSAIDRPVFRLRRSYLHLQEFSMSLRSLFFGVVMVLAVFLSGCGGSNDPVNEGKDVPKKKDK
jgi:hypothetical protein